MNYGKTLLTLLAIFCVIVSAGMVCATDQGGYAGINYQDANGVSGSQYYVHALGIGNQTDLNQTNQTNTTLKVLEPGNGLPLENQTGYVPADANGNPINNATGNATAPAGHNASNTTTPTTHNATNTTSHNATAPTSHNTTNSTASRPLPATGNPVVAIWIVTSIIGGYAILRRKD